jgi:hypothetical protein
MSAIMKKIDMGKETLEMKIGEKMITIEHEFSNETGKAFKYQSRDALPALRHVISQGLSNGKITGFIPYNNFESSVDWVVSN